MRNIWLMHAYMCAHARIVNPSHHRSYQTCHNVAVACHSYTGDPTNACVVRRHKVWSTMWWFRPWSRARCFRVPYVRRTSHLWLRSEGRVDASVTPTLRERHHSTAYMKRSRSQCRPSYRGLFLVSL